MLRIRSNLVFAQSMQQQAKIPIDQRVPKKQKLRLLQHFLYLNRESLRSVLVKEVNVILLGYHYRIEASCQALIPVVPRYIGDSTAVHLVEDDEVILFARKSIIQHLLCISAEPDVVF